MSSDRLLASVLERLEPLCNAIGCSGHEEDIAEIILGFLSKLTLDSIKRDALGNIIATKRGKRPDVLLLDGHMDEVGLMVQHIDADGFLVGTGLGGWDPRVLPGQDVRVRVAPNRYIMGTIGSIPPHVQKTADMAKAFEIEQLWIDVGASNAEEVAAMGIQMGTTLVPYSEFTKMNEKVIRAKALDDRVGCALALAILGALDGETPDMTIVASFSIGEEVGLRGASVLAPQIEPAICFVLEATVDGATPAVSAAMRPTKGGLGPAITLADKSTIVSEKMIAFLEATAKAANIPYQRKRPTFGGTNAGAIHKSHKGVLTGVISCPCRYIHGPHSQLQISDLHNTAKLALEATRKAASLLPVTK